MASLSHAENQGGWKNCAFQNWYQMLVRLAAHNFQRATVYYTKAQTDPRFLSISVFTWLIPTINTSFFFMDEYIHINVRITFCLDILIV